MDWRHNATCLDEDPELFFPIGNGGPAQLQSVEAKAVCQKCPVRTDCLDWALQRSVVGIWGGTTVEERRALKLVRMERTS